MFLFARPDNTKRRAPSTAAAHADCRGSVGSLAGRGYQPDPQHVQQLPYLLLQFCWLVSGWVSKENMVYTSSGRLCSLSKGDEGSSLSSSIPPSLILEARRQWETRTFLWILFSLAGSCWSLFPYFMFISSSRLPTSLIWGIQQQTKMPCLHLVGCFSFHHYIRINL